MTLQLHTRRTTLATAVLAALAALTATQPARAAAYSWATGPYSSTGLPATISAADTLAIGTGGTKYLDTAITTAGTVSWSDAVYFQNGNTVSNSGSWLATTDAGLYDGNYGGTFVNSGTFAKTGGAGSTSIGNNVSFVNSGTVNAQTGTIAFDTATATFNAGTQFTGAGTVQVNNGAAFNGAFTSQNLVLAGGNFAGSSAQLSGSATWAGGSFTGSWQVAAGQTLLARAGGGTKYVNGSITNAGTLTAADTLYFQNGNTLTNQGTLNLQGDVGLADGNYSGTVTNNGTLRKTAGSGTSVVGNVTFINNGTLNVQSGSVAFNGGSTTFNTGTVISGSGTVVVNSNASFIGTISTQGNLVLAGGNFNGGNGNAGSMAVLNGNANWQGGSFTGSWQVASGRVLTAQAGGGTKYINGSLDNRGTIQTADTLYLQNGNSFSNVGLLDLQADVGINDGNYSGTLTNTGTLRKSAGTGSSNVGSITFVNSGTINAQTGTLNFTSGSLRFNNGTAFTGAGQVAVSGGATFVGGYTTQGNLTLTGASFNGGDGTAGSVAVMNGNTIWRGGSLTGSWQVPATTVLTVQDGNGSNFINGTLNNLGRVQTTTTLYLQNGNMATNGALVDLQGDVGLADGNYAGTFTNNGVLRKSAGTGTSSVTGITFVNNGEVNAQVGTINFASGNLRFNDGSKFTGSGQVLVSSAATFVGGYTTQNNLTLSGNAAFNGGDGSTGSTATMNGNTVLRGGSLTGSWQVASGTTLAVQSGGGSNYVNGSVSNAGSIVATDTLYLQNGNTLRNTGRYTLQGDVGLADGNYNGFVVNTGTIIKTAGAGTSDLSGINFSNAAGGVVDVRTGTIQLPGNFGNAGTVTGVGTIATTGSFTNSGHVAPGNGVGRLTLGSSFVQGASGSFDVDITSLASHDLLVVAGSATLGGTLAVNCFANCSFAVGDRIEVLDYTGGRTGSFASLTLSGFATGAFTAVYDDANSRVLLQVTQAVTAAVPEPESWALMAGGLALLGWLARRRRA